MAFSSRPIAHPVSVGGATIHGGMLLNGLTPVATSIGAARTPITINPSPISGGPTAIYSRGLGRVSGGPAKRVTSINANQFSNSGTVRPVSGVRHVTRGLFR